MCANRRAAKCWTSRLAVSRLEGAKLSVLRPPYFDSEWVAEAPPSGGRWKMIDGVRKRASSDKRLSHSGVSDDTNAMVPP